MADIDRKNTRVEIDVTIIDVPRSSAWDELWRHLLADKTGGVLSVNANEDASCHHENDTSKSKIS